MATSSWTLSRGFFELVATDLNKAFNNNEADLTECIKQMKTAFETLAAFCCVADMHDDRWAFLMSVADLNGVGWTSSSAWLSTLDGCRAGCEDRVRG